MQNPYYDMTVPIFTKSLASLTHLLTKGQEYAVEKGINEETMLNNRIAPDMLPLVRQVQIATDNAKSCVARLCGVEAPVMEDTETTVAELQSRIANTITFIESLTPTQFEGAHDRKVFVKYFPDTHFLGYNYLTEYALPNYFFHLVTAYDLLRAMGAPIGKADYIGSLKLQPNEAA